MSHTADVRSQLLECSVSQRGLQGFAMLVCCLFLLSCILVQSVVPALVGSYSALLLTLRARGLFSLPRASAIFWIGLAPILSVRVLEYGRNASVFDPLFGAFLLASLGLFSVLSLGVALEALFRDRYIDALVSVIFIPAFFVALRRINGALSDALGVYYK